MKRLRMATAALVVATALTATDSPPGPPVGGARNQSCMAAVYELLGIWAFYPFAVASVYALGCALYANF